MWRFLSVHFLIFLLGLYHYWLYLECNYYKFRTHFTRFLHYLYIITFTFIQVVLRIENVTWIEQAHTRLSHQTRTFTFIQNCFKDWTYHLNIASTHLIITSNTKFLCDSIILLLIIDTQIHSWMHTLGLKRRWRSTRFGWVVYIGEWIS